MFDGLGLLLGVFFIGGAPIDFDVHAMFGGEGLGGVFGAHAGGLENGITLGLRDEAEGDRAGGGGGQRSAEREAGGGEEE